jgi:hypothetical protein
MRPMYRFLGSLALFALVTSTAAFAAPTIESTPVPTRPKPDLSSMNYLIGTWTCSNLSSRRPGPFTVTQVYSMDPTGYWVVRNDTTHKASWIPAELQSETKITYDAVSKHWIRITTTDRGGYAVSTAPMTTGKTRTFTYVTQTQTPDIASYAPEVYTRVSDTQRSMTTSFTETNGHVVTVKQTCTKS